MAIREGIDYLPLLDGADPADILAAMSAITHALLGRYLPGEHGAALLRSIGLAALQADQTAT